MGKKKGARKGAESLLARLNPELGKAEKSIKALKKNTKKVSDLLAKEREIVNKAQDGKWEEVFDAIDNNIIDANLSFKGINGEVNTLIACAAQYSKWDKVKALIAKGANPNASFTMRLFDSDLPSKEMTLIRYVIEEKKEWKVASELVIWNNCDKDTTFINEVGIPKTLIGYAAENNEWETVRKLVTEGKSNPNTEMIIECGQKPIPLAYFAAKKEKWDVVQDLVKNGVDLEKTYVGINDKFTLPVYAAMEGQWNVVSACLEKGASAYSTKSGSIIELPTTLLQIVIDAYAKADEAARDRDFLEVMLRLFEKADVNLEKKVDFVVNYTVCNKTISEFAKHKKVGDAIKEFANADQDGLLGVQESLGDFGVTEGVVEEYKAVLATGDQINIGATE